MTKVAKWENDLFFFLILVMVVSHYDAKLRQNDVTLFNVFRNVHLLGPQEFPTQAAHPVQI